MKALSPIAQEFKNTYLPRVIVGQILCYSLVILGIVFRVFFDQIGIWQGWLLSIMVIFWLLIYLGATRKKYHNYGKNSSLYQEVEGLESLHSKYVYSFIFIILAPIILCSVIQTTLPEYVKTVRYLKSSDDISKSDWTSDYYHIDLIRMHNTPLYRFWYKSTNRGTIQSVNVTAFREIDKPAHEVVHYFYAKNYSHSKSPISEDQVEHIRSNFYRTSYEELAHASTFRSKCLRRLRSSENQSRFLSRLKSEKPSETKQFNLFLIEDHSRKCISSPLKTKTILTYVFWILGVFGTTILLTYKSIEYQHKMTLCIEKHQRKREKLQGFH